MKQESENTLIHLWNDVAFKWIFGREKESRPLIKLLNAVVSHDGLGPGFSEIEIKNPYDVTQPLSKQKQGILDIRAKDKNSGIWVDLEMEASAFTFYPNRSLYYLAGMYRDQLPKGKDNYYKLRPCFGIHLLMSDIFFGDKCNDWFHHFGMLNHKTHKQLNNHFELYYIELDKFQKLVSENTINWGELEQWSDYIAKPQDPYKSLPGYLETNEEIKEVHLMLQTFTRDDRLQEQYRLEEEWLRVQRTEEYARQQLQQDYFYALKMKEQAEKEKEKEILLRKKAEQRRYEAFNALKEKDQEIIRLKQMLKSKK
ncbi:hypothetical protein MHK_008839 [Candidatus Magnetomorum sp. HK-1]|nr:hypothetical protein MHK_008839 [Candidatus Magnetomorum sp. HK-1]